MRLLIATSNPHKLGEIRAVFDSIGEKGGAIKLLSLADLPACIEEPVEDQPTFEGNALKKALHYAAASGLPTLADDSGLEVDALGGEPGVRSARYAGVQGPRNVVDPANNHLLLERLAGVSAKNHTARFVCTMALAKPFVPSPLRERQGEGVVSFEGSGMRSLQTSFIEGQDSARVIATVRGTVEGRIIGDGEPPRGENGFGYDPLFFLPELGKTMAELSPEQKNALSHRGRAARAIWPKVKALAAQAAEEGGTTDSHR